VSGFVLAGFVPVRGIQEDDVIALVMVSTGGGDLFDACPYHGQLIVQTI
jgi:hypothetical protein